MRFADWEREADRCQRRRWLASTLMLIGGIALGVLARAWWPQSAPAPRPPAAAMVVQIAPAMQGAQQPSPQVSEAAQMAAAAPAADPEREPEPEPKSKPEPAPEPELASLPEVGTPAPSAPAEPVQREPKPKPETKTERTPQQRTPQRIAESENDGESQAAAPQTSAPASPARTPAQTAGAPRRSAPTPVSKAEKLRYAQQLLAYLERHKRYPRAAKRRGQQGVSYVRFTITQGGQVVVKHLERSAGFSILDAEALDLLARSQPLPPIPRHMHRDRLEIVVPISFALR